MIADPIESLMRNTYFMINIAERNRIGTAFYELWKNPGMGKVLFRRPPRMVPQTYSAEQAANALAKSLDMRSEGSCRGPWI
jgi:hypothetical protein